MKLGTIAALVLLGFYSVSVFARHGDRADAILAAVSLAIALLFALADLHKNKQLHDQTDETPTERAAREHEEQEAEQERRRRRDELERAFVEQRTAAALSEGARRAGAKLEAAERRDIHQTPDQHGPQIRVAAWGIDRHAYPDRPPEHEQSPHVYQGDTTPALDTLAEVLAQMHGALFVPDARLPPAYFALLLRAAFAEYLAGDKGREV